MTRKYEKCLLTGILQREGTNLKSFAIWLKETPEGLIKKFKREMTKNGGISKEFECSISTFVMEKRGVKIKLDIFKN